MGGNDLIVERAAVEDGDWIARAQVAMAQESEGMGLDLETVRQGVRRIFDDAPARGFYIVARPPDGGGKPLGCLLVQSEWSEWRNAEVWWIHSVFVPEEHRGRGVFRSLFDSVESEAREAGARGLRLIVDRDNTRAQKIYARLGMTGEHYLTFEKMF